MTERGDIVGEKMQELAHIMEHLRSHTVFYIGNIPVSSTVVTTWLVMVVLIVAVFLATRNLSSKPRGVQHILEMVVGFIEGLLEDAMGKEGRKYLPLIATLFIFILSLNLSWFIPTVKPPTIDISTTAAFGVTTIILVQIFAIQKKGLGGYLRHFIEPNIVLAPLTIIEEFVKPVSLSLRLFGNMFGEKMVVTILFILVPLIIPTPVMLLGVLMGFIQAFVFTLLPITYIQTFIKGH
ncbi:MAG: F0F1 ATP synthase subunit A [Thermoanaerobacteraceae bacterium]|nr:F0F1 ATP synthase subunit A [Thermoanaerobacteraceae bacterium]